jgi:hypothetical protein
VAHKVNLSNSSTVVGHNLLRSDRHLGDKATLFAEGWCGVGEGSTCVLHVKCPVTKIRAF